MNNIYTLIQKGVQVACPSHAGTFIVFSASVGDAVKQFSSCAEIKKVDYIRSVTPVSNLSLSQRLEYKKPLLTPGTVYKKEGSMLRPMKRGTSRERGL